MWTEEIMAFSPLLSNVIWFKIKAREHLKWKVKILDLYEWEDGKHCNNWLI